MSFDLMNAPRPALEDVVVDLGSGLGHVVLLAAICTAARCIGIEREAAYVDSARRSARALRVDNATFIRCDARMADFSTGTLFYFYTPFLGDVLRTVLDALRAQAALRDIRIAAFGPACRSSPASRGCNPPAGPKPGALRCSTRVAEARCGCGAPCMGQPRRSDATPTHCWHGALSR